VIHILFHPEMNFHVKDLLLYLISLILVCRWRLWTTER